MDLNKLNKILPEFPDMDRMPVLFLGHGSPMNAIEENEFVKGFRKIGSEIPKPAAILCISAHWETRGTRITAMEKPGTIHDFGGFPKELYNIQYPAPGSPELAQGTKDMITGTSIELDNQWGFDHGAWSVIRHLYPDADVPMIQMSLDHTQAPRYHYELGKELAALRGKGILIVGSGNLVHNLGMVNWRKMNEVDYAYDWTLEAKEKMNHFILNGDHTALVNYSKHGEAFQLAIPTPEHYLPMLYTLALKDKNDTISLFNDKAVGGSMTMTSLQIG